MVAHEGVPLSHWSDEVALLSDWLMNAYWLQTMIYFGARLLHRDLEEGEGLLDEGRSIKFKTLIKTIPPPPQE